MRTAGIGFALALALSACSPGAAPAGGAPVTLGDNAVNPGPLVRDDPQPQPGIDLTRTHWPPARVGSGHARISCERDDRADEPRSLDSLEFFSLVDAMSACQGTGLVRLQYSGRIDSGFTAADVLRAMHGHVLAEATVHATYSLNPAVEG